MRILNKSMLTVLLLTAGAVQAVEYKQVQPALSTLGFGYKQMGVAMEGKFNKFSAQITIDPAKPERALARFEVALTSIDTGSKDADDEVASKLWFNTKTYPTASFVASGIKPLGGNRYQATGKLTIKGRTQEVSAPVTFKSEAGRGIFSGNFVIKRLAYGIGEGMWADLSTVGDDIQIVFHLVATEK